jgi:uncharacterized protein (TIGR03067 family)
MSRASASTVSAFGLPELPPTASNQWGARRIVVPGSSPLRAGTVSVAMADQTKRSFVVKTSAFVKESFMRDCAVVAFAIVLPMAFAQEPNVKDEIKKLEGNWVQTSVNGRETANEKDAKNAPKVTILIEGEKWIEKSAAAPRESPSTFKIDPAKKPKHIDKTVTISDKPVTFPGIYELEGDTLKVCMPFSVGGDFSKIDKRPTEFKVSVPDGFMLMTYKRVKE